MTLSNLEFTNPYWLIILPLPLLLYYILPSYQTKELALKVPFFQTIISALDEKPKKGSTTLKPNYWQRITLFLTWIIIVFALTNPMLLGPPKVREASGRDIMIVVDLSQSMDTKDFDKDNTKIGRLDAVKYVLKDFISKRQGDRFGLILFGDLAFVQAPFTSDYQVWTELLDETRTGMAGQSTHLGDAIGLAIKTLLDNSKDNIETEKLAIILTDGNDTNSYVSPTDAAQIAKAKGVRIHMIAIGDPKTVGEDSLNMDIINNVAKSSGGQSFRALNQADLQKAYDDIDQLEPQVYQSTTYRPKLALHFYLIALLALYLLLIYSLACYQIYRKRKVSHE